VIGWFEAVVLGVLQGLTEFLPISSSAHLLVFSELFGWEDPGAAFTAVTQIGTEAAVLLYFRKDLWRIITAWTGSLVRPSLRGSIDARMGWYVIVGTIPIAVLGLAFTDQIETVVRDLRLTAVMLIAFGLLLGLADRVGREVKPMQQLTLRDGFLYGLGQACALIPGVSRSGGTITMGLFLGYTREAAARYSFLLAIPAVLASGFYEATRLSESGSVSWGPTILAAIVAFAVGYAVIAWFLRFIATHTFAPFVIYRVGFGALILLLLATGAISAT
jgi:undecaprenyl-diphosphatase